MRASGATPKNVPFVSLRLLAIRLVMCVPWPLVSVDTDDQVVCTTLFTAS